MKAPQIILIIIMAMGLGIEMMQHGEPETGKHNFWSALLGKGILITLLWLGGFWG